MGFLANRASNLVFNSAAAVALLLASATSCGDDEDDDGGGGVTGGEAGEGAKGGSSGRGGMGGAEEGGTGGRGGSATGGRGGTTGGTSTGGAGGAEGGQAGGGAAGLGGAGGEGGGGTTLPDGMLDPTPYLSRADSPFTDLTFASYFHLEDWEDDALDTPGVTTTSATLGSSFGSGFVDSVDGDDGVVDGLCAPDCNTLWEAGPVTFTFDETALGGLPTHVGAVWTDGPGGTSALFEAFDAADVSLGIAMDVGNADGNNSGSVAEDRFLGVVHAMGVKRIVISSSSGAIEVDHLQYGR